jgi:16S rRNA (uracil1498-N3)-methyltransferase
VKQYLLPRSYAGEATLTLGGEDFRYLVRVLRMREGDELRAIDARGAAFTMLIRQAGRGKCVVELRSEAPPSPQPDAPRITLLQCLPKGRKIDLIVRQATEAGVARIVLLQSEHSQVRPGEDDGRLPRLERVAREAVQQSGNPLLPEIEGPLPLLATLCAEKGEWGVALFFHERPLPGGATEMSPGATGVPLHRLLAGAPRAVSILIGPEGGLSAKETELLGTAGFQPVYLGAGILRVETAATYALGAVQTILREREEWRLARNG